MLNHVPQETTQTLERPKGTKRRWYSEQEKADALAAVDSNGGNLWVTARKLTIPYVTLKQWYQAGVEGRDRMQPVTTAQVLTDAKRDHIQALKAARWLYLDRLSEPEAVAKTSGYYAAVTWKVLNEGIALAEGGATSRVELSLASFLTQASLPWGGGEGNPE